MKTRRKYKPIRTERRYIPSIWIAFFLMLGSFPGLRAQNIVSSPESPFIRAPASDSEKPKFQWNSAVLDASLFLGIEHGFRLLQDPLVRQGLRGPFFGDYVGSIENIHGWNDGDPFVVNYIGHPIEGAVAGFIEIHNDPRYRAVEIGETRQYWKSRLRAMGFSAVYSLQFEIGPIGEASIGNSQMHPHTGGVVDWVITPTVGTAWIVAEDLTDKYLVRAVERRTENTALLAMARTLLNPCRGFSNIMGRRAPWHRDDRPGIKSLVLPRPRDLP